MKRFSAGRTEYWAISADAETMLNEFQDYGNWAPETLNELLIFAGITPAIDPFLFETANEDPYAFELPVNPVMSPDLMLIALLMTQRDEPDKFAVDWQGLESTPEAVVPQIVFHTWACNGIQRAYELARFITPKNYSGLINSIQTAVTFGDDDTYRWPVGDPRWYTRTLGVNVGQIFLSWAMMIETRNTTNDNHRNLRQQAIVTPAQWIHEIPGVVHKDMEPWNEMLFLWGWDHQVHWRCPSNTAVSLWIYIHESPADNGIRNFSGMLKGFTQTNGSCRTFKNFTKGY